MSKNLNSKKLAIILLNLGGPDSLKAVKPFLFSLFYDKAIINLPNPLRYIIAKFISITREKKSQELYRLIGNKSPLLEETEAQKNALTVKLNQELKEDFKVFVAMRHYHPNSADVIKEIEEYKATEIILLPLYPQFSTTTTGSSVKNFIETTKTSNLKNINIKTICCYHENEDFIEAHAEIISENLKKFGKSEKLCILFSAHGLPVKIIKAGDPYQWQIENTVKKIVDRLNIQNLDYQITYQSKIGPVEWLKPCTEEVVRTAAEHGKAILIVPIAFVSEHVETLVELDIEYAEIAKKYDVTYIRAPALRTSYHFIKALSNMVIKMQYSIGDNKGIVIGSDRICDKGYSMCLCNGVMK